MYAPGTGVNLISAVSMNGRLINESVILPIRECVVVCINDVIN